MRKSLHPHTVEPGTDRARCYELLNLTSRSFAAVIAELHPELRDAIALFYLVLRALDTIEDDMSIDPKIKIPILRTFDQVLNESDWSFDGVAETEKDRPCVVEFPVILHELHKLKPEYFKVIQEITYKMGNGMADYIQDEQFNLNGVDTVKAYDLYCHYVAGLVGDGLTQMVVLAKFGEASLYNENKHLMESMGLFLQKTNIIRDYAEDLDDGRSFWPKEIWSKYADKLPDFQKNQQQGVWCINDLVLNALGHVTDVLHYLASVHDASTFNFCAIPQVMAIATLSLVFNNKEILTSHKKIRRGTTCDLILRARTLKGCIEVFQFYIRDIKNRVDVRDPNYLKLMIAIAKIEQYIEEMYQDNLPRGVKPRQTEIYLLTKKKTESEEQIAEDVNQENITMNMSVLCVLLPIWGVLGYQLEQRVFFGLSLILTVVLGYSFFQQ